MMQILLIQLKVVYGSMTFLTGFCVVVQPAQLSSSMRRLVEVSLIQFNQIRYHQVKPLLFLRLAVLTRLLAKASNYDTASSQTNSCAVGAMVKPVAMAV